MEKSQTDNPKLLILAQFGPDDSSGGPALLRSILQDYPSHQLLWLILEGPHKNTKWWRPEIDRRWINIKIPKKGMKFKIIRYIWETFNYQVTSIISANKAIKLASEFKPDVCWAVLDFKVLRIIHYFCKKSHVPVHMSVHDDPIIATQIAKFSISKKKIENDFRGCLSYSTSQDCISNRLGELYKKKYGINPFIIVKGVELKEDKGDKKNRTFNMQEKINIVLTGAPWTDSHWPNTLLEGLTLLRQKLNIEFHVFGMKSFPPIEKWVVVHPFVTENEFNQLLETMDIGYAYDPMTDVGREFAATSFPTKVATYIGAGLPFLYQGPRDSTVGDILKQYQVGTIVESIDPTDLAAGFLEILSNYVTMRSECARCTVREFDLSKIREKLINTLRNDVVISSK